MKPRFGFYETTESFDIMLMAFHGNNRFLRKLGQRLPKRHLAPPKLSARSMIGRRHGFFFFGGGGGRRTNRQCIQVPTHPKNRKSPDSVYFILNVPLQNIWNRHGKKVGT